MAFSVSSHLIDTTNVAFMLQSSGWDKDDTSLLIHLLDTAVTILMLQNFQLLVDTLDGTK